MNLFAENANDPMARLLNLSAGGRIYRERKFQDQRLSRSGTGAIIILNVLSLSDRISVSSNTTSADADYREAAESVHARAHKGRLPSYPGPGPDKYNHIDIQIVDPDHYSDSDIVAPCSPGPDDHFLFSVSGSHEPGRYHSRIRTAGTGFPTDGVRYGPFVFEIIRYGALDIVGAGRGSGVRAWLNNTSLDAGPQGAVSDHHVVESMRHRIMVEWTAPAENISVSQIDRDMDEGPAEAKEGEGGDS